MHNEHNGTFDSVAGVHSFLEIFSILKCLPSYLGIRRVCLLKCVLSGLRVIIGMALGDLLGMLRKGVLFLFGEDFSQINLTDLKFEPCFIH